MEKANRLVLCCILILPLFYSIDQLAATVPGLQLSDKWTYYPGGGNLVLANGCVYFLTANGYQSSSLVAVNASTGSYVWSSPSKAKTGVYDNTPAYYDGYIYTSTDAFNATTGELLLDYSNYSQYGSPRVTNGILLITAHDPTNGFAPDSLLALNAKTGSKVWSFNEGKNLIGGSGHMMGFENKPPAVVNGIAYFCCASGVYAFNVQTGGQLWRFPIIAFGDSVVANSKIVLVSHRDSDVYASNMTLYCLDASTGQSKWTHFIDGVDEPAMGKDMVYVGGYALSIAAGTILWNNTNLERSTVSEGIVFSGLGSSVFAFNASDGEEIANYTFSSSATVASIVSAKNLVLVKTDSDRLVETGYGYDRRVNSQVSALELSSPATPAPSTKPAANEDVLNTGVKLALGATTIFTIFAVVAIISHRKSSRSKSVERR